MASDMPPQTDKDRAQQAEAGVRAALDARSEIRRARATIPIERTTKGRGRPAACDGLTRDAQVRSLASRE